jgi:predicted kinase
VRDRPSEAGAPLVLALPEPCLVVLVGAAGSGKTTLAGRLFPPAEVLSSDAYRGIIAGDEADQTVTRTAFRLLHRDLERRLAAGLTTVVDATSVTAFARRSLTRIAERHGVAAVAIVLDLPADLVLARNATRSGRIVPEAAVRRQLADLERSMRRGELEREGFAAWHVLRAAGELEEVRLVREASSPRAVGR